VDAEPTVVQSVTRPTETGNAAGGDKSQSLRVYIRDDSVSCFCVFCFPKIPLHWHSIASRMLGSEARYPFSVCAFTRLDT